MPSAESLALLKELCTIPATAGDEQLLSDWILRYTLKHQNFWKQQPEIFAGDGFQEAIVLMFGRPRLAVFAHLDTVGYCTAYGDRLVPIGKPKAKSGTTLLGEDAAGALALTLRVEEHPKEDDYKKISSYTKEKEEIKQCLFNSFTFGNITKVFQQLFFSEKPCQFLQKI